MLLRYSASDVVVVVVVAVIKEGNYGAPAT